MHSDLPWSQPELPVIEPVTGYTRLDLHGPHDLMACGFKTRGAADRYIVQHFGGGSRDPVLGPLEGPDGILISEQRVGRGICVLRFPRWELESKVPW